jgi:hypothetical protein
MLRTGAEAAMMQKPFLWLFIFSWEDVKCERNSVSACRTNDNVLTI